MTVSLYAFCSSFQPLLQKPPRANRSNLAIPAICSAEFLSLSSAATVGPSFIFQRTMDDSAMLGPEKLVVYKCYWRELFCFDIFDTSRTIWENQSLTSSYRQNLSAGTLSYTDRSWRSNQRTAAFPKLIPFVTSVFCPQVCRSRCYTRLFTNLPK